MPFVDGPQGELLSSDPADQPYVSVVATARNDNHGGNLLRRMQAFVSGWITQAKRHNLASELILVEWNPPAGKPPLAEALTWPADTSPCTVRIIEVPAEVHRRYAYADALPLYQMIAKNVGIRRARGEFVLVTNIDIIFSDELMRFLAERRLRKRRIYRIDRTDIASDIPVEAPMETQLDYCRRNIIRLCTRDGIFKLTPEGLRARETPDIVPEDSKIWFGYGWYEVECYVTEPFRWMRDQAELILRVPRGNMVLALDVEPGPGVGPIPQPLIAIDEDGRTVAEWSIPGRTVVQLHVPRGSNGGLRTIRLISPTGGLPVVHDTRIMNFRLFRVAFVKPDKPARLPSVWKILVNERPTLARLALSGGGFKLWKAIRLLRLRGTDVFDAGEEFQIGSGWSHLERLETETFRWVSHDVELLFRFKDRTRSLALLVGPGPSIGYQPFDLVIRLKNGDVVHRSRVDRMAYIEFELALNDDELTSVFLNAEGYQEGRGISVPGDSRTMIFRVFACGRGTTKAPPLPVPVVPEEEKTWTSRIASTRPAEIEWPERLRAQEKQIAQMGKPRALHLFACGDFQLMAREHWDDLRGYAELDQFSMHLDSLLSYAAHHRGIEEEVLEPPLRVFHIEHSVGSGWTPEGYKQLSETIAKKGIQSITFPDLAEMVSQMRQVHAPLIFNLDDWGLAGFEFAETVPGRVAKHAVPQEI